MVGQGSASLRSGAEAGAHPACPASLLYLPRPFCRQLALLCSPPSARTLCSLLAPVPHTLVRDRWKPSDAPWGGYVVIPVPRRGRSVDDVREALARLMHGVCLQVTHHILDTFLDNRSVYCDPNARQRSGGLAAKVGPLRAGGSRWP